MRIESSTGKWLVVVGMTVMAAGGCVSVQGSWKMVETEPPGVPFPLEHVTFDEDNRYTASWSENGKKRTSTGTYRLRGSALEIGQIGRQPRNYYVTRRGDGNLVLTFRENEHEVSAILVPEG